MVVWRVEKIQHFAAGEFVVDGLSHFGFQARDGRYYAIDHPNHVVALLAADGSLEWTLAARPVSADVPNIAAELDFPIYVDALPDRRIVVSSFGSARLHVVDVEAMRAELLVEGRDLGLVDMGNCVVDDEGHVWVNEVRGCRVWRFDAGGRVVRTVGDGTPGFQEEAVGLDEARFSWIYDLRRGPDGNVYVLDSRNFAVRVIDLAARQVRTLAGNGTPGYAGDGGPARAATFGSDPDARFDGPISLALDESGNVYVGDRFNHVVRMIDAADGVVTTIAGRPDADLAVPNDPAERDPRRVNLPAISSLDYRRGALFVPTDLADDAGDLVVLRQDRSATADPAPSKP